MECRSGRKAGQSAFCPRLYLTSSLRCGIEPPSNAASGKAAGTGHDTQRAPYRNRKAGRRHSLRPPPAESPAHLGSIARRRRDHLRFGSLDRVHAPVSGTGSCGVAASCRAGTSHQSSDVPTLDTFGRFVGSRNEKINSGSIPAVASRRTEPGARHAGTPTNRHPQLKGGRCEPSLWNEGKQGPPVEAAAWSAAETETETRGNTLH